MAKNSKAAPQVVPETVHGGPIIHVANQKTGEVGEMSAQEYQEDPDNFAAQGWVPISKDQVEPLLARQRSAEDDKEKIRDAESGTGKLKTAAENFTANAVDAFTAIPRAVSAAASHIAGKEDPFADMTGRDLLTSFSGVRSLQDLTGQVSLEEAKRQQDFREAMATRARQNPITAGVSGLAGAVVGAEAGGLGGLGSAARGGAAEALGTGVLGRVAGRAAQGAVEGAPLALTGAQDQAYLEGRRLTGEQAYAALGQGLLLGGAVGGGFGVLGEGLAAAGTAASGSRAAGAVRRIASTSDEAFDRVIGQVTKADAAPGASGFLRRAFSGESLEEMAAKAGPDELPAIEQAQTVFDRAHEGQGTLEGIGDHLVGHKLKGAFLGHMIGGPVGAAAGAAASATYDFVKSSVTNPAKFLEQKLAIERAAMRAKSVVGNSLDGLFAGVGKATDALAPSRRLVTAMELFQGRHDSADEAYTEREKQILELNQNFGEKIRQNAGTVFGSTFDHDPHAVGAAISAATTGADFLQSKLPVPIFDADSFTPTASRPRPSPFQLQEFAEHWAAVVHPLKVLEGLPYGLVSQQQMQTMQLVSPNFYNFIREEADSRIRDYDAKGIEIPIRQRQILNQAFSLNGAGEPTFSPEFALTYGPGMADSKPEQRPPQRPGPGKSKVSSRFSTRTNKMLDDEV